mgnify:CR=1 FL=1
MDGLLGVLKALSDETRLHMVTLLLKHDFCVGALAKNLSVSKAAVSQHLQVLRKAGVVKGEKRGYFTHYHVSRDLLKEVAEQLMELSSQEKQRSGNCTQNTEGEHICCRKEGDSDE